MPINNYLINLKNKRKLRYYFLYWRITGRVRKRISSKSFKILKWTYTIKKLFVRLYKIKIRDCFFRLKRRSRWPLVQCLFLKSTLLKFIIKLKEFSMFKRLLAKRYFFGKYCHMHFLFSKLNKKIKKKALLSWEVNDCKYIHEQNLKRYNLKLFVDRISKNKLYIDLNGKGITHKHTNSKRKFLMDLYRHRIKKISLSKNLFKGHKVFMTKILMKFFSHRMIRKRHNIKYHINSFDFEIFKLNDLSHFIYVKKKKGQYFEKLMKCVKKNQLQKIIQEKAFFIFLKKKFDRLRSRCVEKDYLNCSLIEASYYYLTRSLSKYFRSLKNYLCARKNNRSTTLNLVPCMRLLRNMINRYRHLINLFIVQSRASIRYSLNAMLRGIKKIIKYKEFRKKNKFKFQHSRKAHQEIVIKRISVYFSRFYSSYIFSSSKNCELVDYINRKNNLKRVALCFTTWNDYLDLIIARKFHFHRLIIVSKKKNRFKLSIRNKMLSHPKFKEFYNSNFSDNLNVKRLFKKLNANVYNDSVNNINHFIKMRAVFLSAAEFAKCELSNKHKVEMHIKKKVFNNLKNYHVNLTHKLSNYIHKNILSAYFLNWKRKCNEKYMKYCLSGNYNKNNQKHMVYMGKISKKFNVLNSISNSNLHPLIPINLSCTGVNKSSYLNIYFNRRKKLKV